MQQKSIVGGIVFHACICSDRKREKERSASFLFALKLAKPNITAKPYNAPQGK